jgi:hypothetical protein
MCCKPCHIVAQASAIGRRVVDVNEKTGTVFAARGEDVPAENARDRLVVPGSDQVFGDGELVVGIRAVYIARVRLHVRLVVHQASAAGETPWSLGRAAPIALAAPLTASAVRMGSSSVVVWLGKVRTAYVRTSRLRKRLSRPLALRCGADSKAAICLVGGKKRVER